MTSELRPVALMHTHDDEFTEFEEYRNGSGCLTQADKDAGWTETPLYTLEAVRAEVVGEIVAWLEDYEPLLADKIEARFGGRNET